MRSSRIGIILLALVLLAPSCGRGGGSNGGGAGGTGGTPTTPPGAFQLAAYPAAAGDLSLTPLLNWTSSSGAASYTLEIDTDSAFTAPLTYQASGLGSGATSHAVATSLQEGTVYYWRVLAVNVVGQTLASNAPLNFTTSLPFWACSFGGNLGDEFRSIIEMADGGFMVAGVRGPDVWLVRLDAAGRVVREFVTGAASGPGCVRLVATSDGGAALSISVSNAVTLMKLDSAGDPQWAKSYSAPGFGGERRGLRQTSDGGFVLAGLNDQDTILVRMDSSGALLWAKTYVFAGSPRFTTIDLASDGFYVGGHATPGFNGEEVFAAKIAADGTFLWGRTIGGSNNEQAIDLVAVPSGMAMAAWTASVGGTVQGWVLRFSDSGNLDFDRVYGGDQRRLGRTIRSTTGGGFVVAGETWDNSANPEGMWAIRVDASDAIVWQKEYGGGGGEGAIAMAALGDGGFAFAGTTSTYGPNSWDAWIVRTPGDGTCPPVALDTTAVGVPSGLAASVLSSLGVIDEMPGITVTTLPTTVTTVSTTVKRQSPIPPLTGPGPSGEWVHTYGGTAQDSPGYKGLVSAHGGYAVAGITYSFGVNQPDAWIVNLAADGSILWQKRYAGTMLDSAVSIVAAGAGYLVAGFTTSFGVSIDSPLLIRLNGDGTLAWSKTYSSGTSSYFDGVRETGDGGFIASGAANAKAWLVKLDSAGAISWQKNYSAGGYFSDVRTVAGGGYVALGAIGSSNLWLVRLDDTGVVLWEKRLVGAFTDYPRQIRQTSDGGFVVAGMCSSFGAGFYDGWVIRLDAAGAVQWQKVLGGSQWDELRGVVETGDGGFLAVGHTASFGVGGSDLWVVKLSSTGVVQWERLFGGVGNDEAMSVELSPDGLIMVLGTTTLPYGIGVSDFWVLKLKADGTAPPIGISVTTTVANSAATVSTPTSTVTTTTVVPVNVAPTVADTPGAATQQAP